MGDASAPRGRSRRRSRPAAPLHLDTSRGGGGTSSRFRRCRGSRTLRGLQLPSLAASCLRRGYCVGMMMAVTMVQNHPRAVCGAVKMPCAPRPSCTVRCRTTANTPAPSVGPAWLFGFTSSETTKIELDVDGKMFGWATTRRCGGGGDRGIVLCARVRG